MVEGKHAVAMYALLPAMNGANGQLIDRAIDEMIQYYQRKKVKRVTTADELKQLFQQLIDAADEDAARSLLT